MGRLGLSVAVGLLCFGACGDRDAKVPAGPGQTQPFHQRLDLPASKKILGTWAMDLANVPEAAMTEDLRRIKQQGLADKMRVEYTFTDTEFILEKMGAGGYVKRVWHYEILSEQDDRLELQRLDEHGKPTKVEVIVRGPTLWVGFGQARIPLTRKWKN